MSSEVTVYADDDEQRKALAIVRPAVDAAQMVEAIKAYEALKAAIVRPSDKVTLGRGANAKEYLTKPYWLRIARAFNLTVEPVSERFIRDEYDDTWGYEVVVRAVAPNGASMPGDGTCWSTEKMAKPWVDRQRGQTMPTEQAINWAREKTAEMQTRHNVRSHAYTRASNRAISNLVAGGEVSAEEINVYATPGNDEIETVRQEPFVPKQWTPPPMQERVGRVAPPPQPGGTSTAHSGKMGIGEFVQAISGLGLDSVQAMKMLGVRTLSGLDLDEAYVKLKAQQSAPLPKSVPVPADVSDDEDGDTVEADVVDADEADDEAANAERLLDEAAWDYEHDKDVEVYKLTRALGYKTVASVQKLILELDGPQPRKTVIMGALRTMLSEQEAKSQPHA